MKQTKEELWAVAADYYKLKSEGKNPIVQYCCSHEDEWRDSDGCLELGVPNFHDGDIWRLKPETIQHKGGEYPKPCTDVDELLHTLHAFTPYFGTNNNRVFPVAHKLVIPNRCVAINAANSGLYYLNRDDAIARAKVIYELD